MQNLRFRCMGCQKMTLVQQYLGICLVMILYSPCLTHKLLLPTSNGNGSVHNCCSELQCIAVLCCMVILGCAVQLCATLCNFVQCNFVQLCAVCAGVACSPSHSSLLTTNSAVCWLAPSSSAESSNQHYDLGLYLDSKATIFGVLVAPTSALAFVL